MIKCLAIILFVTLVTSASSYYDSDDLDNLGARISANVQHNLAPLDNLGARISANVQQNLAPLDNLGARISANVQHNLAPLHHLGARINADVEENLKPLRSMENGAGKSFNPGLGDLGSQIAASVQAGLAPLNNLGQQIQHNVAVSLQPVKALEIINQMRIGTGGVTIATHEPSGERFIFKNGMAYQCKGTISDSGNCEGELTPFAVKNDSDFCYIHNSYSIINDHVCIGATSVQVINNKIQCTNYNQSPVLVMKKDKYAEMCKKLSQSTTYKYIADPNHPAHVKIPNDNKFVRCSNNEKNVCIFTETNPMLGTSNGNQFVNNVYSWNSNSYITY